MEVRKLILLKTKRLLCWLVIAVVGLQLFGCGSSTVIRKVEFKPPDIHFDIKSEIVLPPGEIVVVEQVYGSIIKDSTGTIDTVYPIYQGVKLNDNQDTSVVAKFFMKDKSFQIDYYPDTLIFYDTIKIDQAITVKGDSLLEKIIWLLSGLVTAAFIWYLKKKRSQNV